ncbi:fimbrial protein [Burkholderia sp. SIMBA_062]|uniref:fimbrial protein n=1 Tax=Burkholderia sp. SIMBA_062 TaxID=3085803 RepID=UPI00397E856E
MATLTTAEISGGKLVPGYTNTYETGIPGIGIQFRAAIPGIANTQIAPFRESTTGTSETFNAGVTLVVTGPVGSGSVAGSTLPTMTWRAAQGTDRISYVLRVSGTLTVTGTTCAVRNASLKVSMPQIKGSALSQVGSTGGDQSFSIDLDRCAQGLKVYLTMTDVTDPSNRSNTLRLDSESTARGIGYQITHDSLPLGFGPDSAIAGNTNQWYAGQPSGNTLSIPLTARYVRTSEQITSGPANARASFTMSYQ